MAIDVTKESLCVNKLVCEKKDIISIQGDMIVPDSKPDILNTITTSGNVCIYKSEVLDGKMRIDGAVSTYIMYLSDSEKDSIRGLNTSIDFSETIVIPELQTGMFTKVKTKIKSIECKVINGRKINIKINLEIGVKIYSKEVVDIITSVQNEDIQVLSKNLKVNSLVEENSCKANVKENISVQNNDNLAEILKSQIEIVNKDTKISYNKVLAKAEIDVKLTYLTEEGKINSVNTKLPAVGFIDIPNVNENNIVDTNYIIKNIIIKPNSVEEHSVYVEIELEIMCIVYEEKQINLIKDLYNPFCKTEVQTNTINTIANKQCKKEICNIRENMNLPELDGNNIIAVEINPTITKENKLNNKIVYDGEVELNFIYEQPGIIGANSKKITIPFNKSIDNIENCEKMNIETDMQICSSEFQNTQRGVTSNIDLCFEEDMYENITIPAINNIEEQEEENMEDYSVVLYIVKKGDTLWNIAKRFKSTINDIARVNGIEDVNTIQAGQKLYIPKYVRPRNYTTIKAMNYV